MVDGVIHLFHNGSGAGHVEYGDGLLHCLGEVADELPGLAERRELC